MNLTATIHPGESVAVVQHCLATYGRTGTTNACKSTLKGYAFVAVCVLQGIDVELQQIALPPDFSLRGPPMQTLLNGSADFIMDSLSITLQRVNAGIKFTNPISNAKYGMLYKRFHSTPYYGMNTSILTARLPVNVIIMVVLSMAVILLAYDSLKRFDVTESNSKYLWEIVREMIPGSNTKSFPVSPRRSLSFIIISASVLSIFYQITYQALVAQSLMIRPGVDIEELPYTVLSRLSAGQTVRFQARSSNYDQVMSSENRFSKLIRAVSHDGVPTLNQSPEENIAAVENLGDVWMSSW